MDSFELNKIMGAVLGTCLALLTLNIAAGAIFSTHAPAKPGYEVAVQEDAKAGAPGQAAPAADEPLPVRFASADVGRGEASAKKCAACHTFGKGEPNRVGPNLYGVVGRQKASENFNYSAAMKGQKGNWTPEDLDTYLTNPKAMVPGTTMSFAGIPRGKERADLIVFLNEQVGQAGGPAQAGGRSAQGPVGSAIERRLPRDRGFGDENLRQSRRIDVHGGFPAGGRTPENRHNRVTIVALIEATRSIACA